MTGASGSKATQVEANTRERPIGRPTRWDALPERRLSTPYTRTRATRWYLDQYAAPAHKIQNFSPHPSACDLSHTCPGCP